MSGIVGIYHPDGKPVDPMDLQRMVDRLAHRGPDGRHIWNEGSVGFGHCMLHTTPESLHEKFPMTSRCGNFVLTADARIDNRDELISTFGVRRHNGHPITDGELILLAYEKWGEDCPKHLLGDFAFAIWDKRDRRLFLARDPMGVRALYYSTVGKGFYFSTEIRALLVLPYVPHTINEAKIAHYLTLLVHDQVSTFYRDILRLPPAHTLHFDGRSVSRSRRYWEIDPGREIRLSSDEEYVQAFRELFTESVRCRLRSAFPVGSTLSGGLDSSSVTVVAGKLVSERDASIPESQARLHTISAIFPSVAEKDRRIDERPYMEAVLASGPFEPHSVRGDIGGILEELREDYDEPVPGIGAYLGRVILECARTQGVRTVLCGLDGDSTVSYGFEHIQDLVRRGEWKELEEECRALAARRGGSAKTYIRHFGFEELSSLAAAHNWATFVMRSADLTRRYNISRRSLLLQATIKPLIPSWALELRKSFLPDEGFKETRWHKRNSSIQKTFARRMKVSRRRDNAEYNTPYADSRKYRYWHGQDLTDGVWELALSTYDRTASHKGVEQRYPFFDRRLMEFCVGLPFDQKLRNGWTRFILRAAMKNLLPEQVYARQSKASMLTNAKFRLIADRSRLHYLFTPDVAASASPYVDFERVKVSLRRLEADPLRATTPDMLSVFLPAALIQWLRESDEPNIRVPHAANHELELVPHS